MARKWLRKRAVCARYGEVVPPEYPLGNKIPFWNEEKLDEHDGKIVKTAADSEATTV
jgi:hypothetical protein